MKKAMIEQLVLGMVGTNTWLIKNKESNELLIIDPADESARIEEKIDRMGGIPVAVLLTHGHFDHMLAADDLRDEYGIPIIACAAEQQVLTDSIKNLSGSWASAHVLLADQWVCDGKKLELAGFSIEVFHTPGHTAGGTCYYIESDKTLMSGDTLFAGSVGRTDYPTASSAAMMESLHDKLCKLPDDTDVYPGHGEDRKSVV
mgnify:CR=1 FL=1